MAARQPLSSPDGLLTQAEGQALTQKGRTVPDEAAHVLAQASLLRQTIYGLFSAVAHKRSPEAGDFATLNSMLSETLSKLLVVPSPSGVTWAWSINKGRHFRKIMRISCANPVMEVHRQIS